MRNNSDHAELGAAAIIFNGGWLLGHELFRVSTFNQDTAKVFIICKGAGNTQCIFTARSALQQGNIAFLLALRSVFCC
jgi:hypothetical protein